MVIFKAEFGIKKAVSSHDKISNFVRDSEIFLNVLFNQREDGERELNQIWLEFHGALAHIPAIKNNRHPRFPGIDKTILCKLKAMDLLFVQECKRQGIESHEMNFGDDLIFVTLLTASTKRLSNEDNAFTTIKDWLEPRSKLVGGKKKAWRGWGIGLIKDDIQARGIALKADDLEQHNDHTRITIRRWKDCSPDVETLMRSIYRAS